MQSNKAELDRLIAMANAGQADVVVVGDETLYSGTLTESQLLSYIAYVKAGISVPSVQVSTADTWTTNLEPQEWRVLRRFLPASACRSWSFTQPWVSRSSSSNSSVV